MTLTLEIAPEIEAALAEKARRRGLALTAYLVDAALRDEVETKTEVPANAEQARQAAIKALAGKYAHLNISSAAIRAERDKDKQREDRFNDIFGEKAG